MKHTIHIQNTLITLMLSLLLASAGHQHVFADLSTIKTPTMTISVASEKNSKPTEAPSVSITTTTSPGQHIRRFFDTFRGAYKDPTVTIINPVGNTIVSQPITKTSSIITLDTPELVPGSYVAKINNEEALTFAWGVLALNSNQDVYTVGDTAYLQMASLSSTGHTLCDSNLNLQLNNQILPVHNSPTCGANNVTDTPDYFAHYTFTSVGTYQLHLTNQDSSYTITKLITVIDRPALTIERTGATRINPFKSEVVGQFDLRRP